MSTFKHAGFEHRMIQKSGGQMSQAPRAILGAELRPILKSRTSTDSKIETLPSSDQARRNMDPTQSFG
jgi:hypothetical protein